MVLKPVILCGTETSASENLKSVLTNREKRFKNDSWPVKNQRMDTE